MKSKIVFCILLSMVFQITLAQQHPFQNPALSFEERAKNLISLLTLDEKLALMCDQSDAIPRLGIRKFNWWSEALHGYANNDNVTVFPQPIGMAAAFNDKMIFDIFDAVSDEARAKYHQWLRNGNENKRFLSLSVWTPNVNIFRDPRWGRGQETYGEDPYLTSRLGLQVVKGLQGPETEKYRKLLACAKHYAVHSGPEWSRHELNLNNVNPRLLYETYLPAFKTLVQDGNVRQVMCAYQRLDDEPCCGSTRLLQRILREEWGYKHLVVADCGAITDFFTTHNVSSTRHHASAKAVLAGTDLECIWDNYHYKTLNEAVEQDLIKEAEIDKSLMRVLLGRFELGDFDNDANVKWAQMPETILNSKKHQQLAYEMAQQSMVLLTNKRNILPLSKSIKKIAVIGPNADDEVMLWGNYNGTPVQTTTILEGIKQKVGARNVVYDKACDLVEDKVTTSFIDQVSFEGKKGIKATYWNTPDRTGPVIATQQITSAFKKTAAGQHEFASGVKLEGFSALFETEFKPTTTEELVFKGGATGYYQLKVNDSILLEYHNWRTLPSRIPYKFEAGKSYKIEIRYAQSNDWQANIEFDFGKEKDIDFSALIQKLKGIDVVVFAGGLSGKLEGEEMPVSYPGFKGGDRTDIELPNVQRMCIQALKAANKKVIFVNCSGSAIALMPEIENTEAILQAWYAGQAGGQAIADVLFGDYNPSGKLPISFYKTSEELGDIEDYSLEGKTYRYGADFLFPFGFGLNYSDFEIEKASINKTNITANDAIELSIPITNKSKRDGTEIIQVYIRKVGDIDGPSKTLRQYQRVEVKGGKRNIAKVVLNYNSFEFFDWSQRKMTVTAGDYELLYGNSSDHKDLQKIKITVQ